MIITFWKGCFVADTLDEKGALGKAGFKLHDPVTCHLDPTSKCKACIAKIGRRYWSDKVEAATRLQEFCNKRALGVMKEHIARLERSWALDAKIVIPRSEEVMRRGWDYKGYQRGGVAYAVQRKDTLFGDDMGLGKTIEALGFCNYTHPKNVLVVTLKSLVFNWRDEAMIWLVDDLEVWPVRSKHEPIPDRDGLFVIANYEKLTGDNPLATSLKKREWDVLIVDECQMMKNEQAARSSAILGDDGLMRRSHRSLFLTGTPIENYPKEIWPIAAAICPAKFGDWWEFMKRYCGLHKEERLIKRKDGTEYVKEEWVTTGATHLGELQQRLRATFMVRRLKRDVLPELPPKRRQLIILEDSKVDWSKHPQFRRWKEIYEREYEERLAKLEAARSEDEYLSMTHELEEFTGVAFEEMSDFRRETALAKLPLCIKYTEHLLASGVENLAIWAHHREVIDRTLKHFGDDVAVAIHGGTPDKGPRSRENSLRLFQEKKRRIFIGQMRAAGAGLNITATHTAVFYESDWTPGRISQCEDRHCRLGQKKMVHALHLILGGTLDANMVKKVVMKQEIIDRALDKMPKIKLKHVAV